MRFRDHIVEDSRVYSWLPGLRYFSWFNLTQLRITMEAKIVCQT
jgi:hypothetical protein